MILPTASIIKTDNVAASAWAGLRRFHNVAFVKQIIMNLHALDKRHDGNARKQAEQIRYCLIQAREYFDASKNVSLATKPVLMYYSIMSLAIAEILLKQDGNSSLDKARGEHAHHGLQFHLTSAKPDILLKASAKDLRATPMIIDGRRRGTFELWHRGSREMPLLGKITHNASSGQSTSNYASIYSALDKRPSLVPESGFSLLDCLQQLPSMQQFVRSHGIQSLTVRSSVELNVNGDGLDQSEYRQIIIHPNDPRVLDIFYENVKVNVRDIQFNGSNIDNISIHEFPNSMIITFNFPSRIPVRHFLPSSANLSKDEVVFSVANHSLNEFGLFYVALYMIGNYARYYPDKWLGDVNEATPLALASEELLAQAEQRVPLLAWSELGRNYFVPD